MADPPAAAHGSRLAARVTLVERHDLGRGVLDLRGPSSRSPLGAEPRALRPCVTTPSVGTCSLCVGACLAQLWKMSLRNLWVVFALSALVGCQATPVPTADAGPDVPADVPFDNPREVGDDARADLLEEQAPDAAADRPIDVTADASGDDAPDAGVPPYESVLDAVLCDHLTRCRFPLDAINVLRESAGAAGLCETVTHEFLRYWRALRAGYALAPFGTTRRPPRDAPTASAASASRFFRRPSSSRACVQTSSRGRSPSTVSAHRSSNARRGSPAPAQRARAPGDVARSPRSDRRACPVIAVRRPERDGASASRTRPTSAPSRASRWWSVRLPRKASRAASSALPPRRRGVWAPAPLGCGARASIAREPACGSWPQGSRASSEGPRAYASTVSSAATVGARPSRCGRARATRAPSAAWRSVTRGSGSCV